MNLLQLFINDELADLADDSPIALTFQINNLAEVKNQQGNTSNQFKLPLTQRNRQILGFPDDVAFATSLPYGNYQAKIVQDGLEIVPAGLAVLNSIDNDTAAITVLSGNVDFFDSIDYKIYDIGDSTTGIGSEDIFKAYKHYFTLDSVIQSQNKTNGWIWPVVDYGKILYPAADAVQLDIRDMRPGFFLKTAIEEMVKQTGYKINPDSFLLKQPLYDKLIVQFANDNFEHSADYKTLVNGQGITVQTVANQNIAAVFSNIKGPVNFESIQNTSNGRWANNKFTAGETFTAVVELVIPKLYCLGWINDTNPTALDIILSYEKAGETINNVIGYDFSNGKWTRYQNTNGGNLHGYNTFEPKKISAEFDMQAGENIFVSYEFKGKNPASAIIYAGALLTIKAKNEKVLPGQEIQCERIFPDINQKDLLKDTLQRFGIICQTDNTSGTITFASFKDILNNIPIAANWTNKCIDQGKTVAFQLGGYAQANYMKYKQDDAITPKGFADAQINVADKTLPASADLFESQFAPTLNRPFIGGSVAQINKVDVKEGGDGDYSISTQPRILIDKKINLLETGRAVTFTDGTRSVIYNDSISVPYFYRPDEDLSLLWEDLRKAYYPELEKILQQTKKIVRYFMLTPRDILELDLLIPIYLEQDGAYYYINKIDSWRKGQPVKVELVKLG
jgi:hypothetical protein